jgi:hypothetical protein
VAYCTFPLYLGCTPGKRVDYGGCAAPAQAAAELALVIAELAARIEALEAQATT